MRKQSILTSLVLGFIALYATGCASITPQKVANVARAGAYAGTAASLAEHPEWRPGFVLAQQELSGLSISTNLDIAQIMAIVNRLPVKELHSQTAQIIITSTTLVISGLELPPIPADKVKDLNLIAQAIAEGIKLGLGP